MAKWGRILQYDPVTPLVTAGNDALTFFARRDLLDEDPGPVESLWTLPDVQKLLRKQRDNGSWRYPGGKEDIRSPENYDQLETFRQLGFLVEYYGMTRAHPAIQNAANFLFGFQTEEGDFRGIYGTQYTPNYSGAIMELLIKAGYGDDLRVEKGFAWLLSIRQHSGGWAIPLQTVGAKLDRPVIHAETLAPDLEKPSSHMVTGCVLRAFAAHDRYRKSEAAQQAGAYLVTRLFKRGEYPGRQTVDFWTKVTYPFWFTDILSALDSLFWLGFTCEHPKIQEGLDWLLDHQREDGLWEVKRLRSDIPWVNLAISRVLKRYCGGL